MILFCWDKVVLLKFFTKQIMRITSSISVLSVSASLSAAQGVNITHTSRNLTNETTTLPEMHAASYESQIGTMALTEGNVTNATEALPNKRINKFKALSDRIRVFFKSWRKSPTEKEIPDQVSPAFVRRR